MERRMCFASSEVPFPIMTLGDLAQHTGQKKDTLAHWVHRTYLETPAPIGYSVAGALYWWPDWLEWFSARRPEVIVQMDRAAMGNARTPDFGRKK